MNELQQHEQNEHCLDRGLLIRLRDGELTDVERKQALAHIETCPDCVADMHDVNVGGKEIYTIFSELNPPAEEVPQIASAFAALRAKIDAEHPSSGVQIGHPQGDAPTRTRSLSVALYHGRGIPSRVPYRYRTLVTIVAAALIAVIVLPNAGVLANQFLALFHVQQFQPVKLDANQSQQEVFNALGHFADTDASSINNQTDVSEAQVKAAIHFPLLLPSHLPTGVKATPRFDLFGGETATFTFNATKAEAYMQQIGDGNVRIPAQLKGATYTITVSPGFAALYGFCQSNDTNKSSTTACRGQIYRAQKQLVLGEVPSPVVQGANANSLNDLRNFMLSLPHLPADVHNLWQNTDLSTGTIPIPMPSVQTNAQLVTIHGGSGVILTDDSVHYGGVIWQAQGIIYVIVTTTSDKSQILETANSLS